MKYRIGLAGCGYISHSDLKGWRRVPDAEVVAVSDLEPEKARQRAAEYGVSQVCGSLSEMLQQVELDAVDILTPPPHKAAVLQAAAHGKHILCQKPFALELADSPR